MAENSYLADSRLFYGLQLEQLAALYQISAMEAFVEEERIFSEGDFGEHLYIVIEGGVRISITTPGEGEEALAILKPGDSFGEMAVIDLERRARSANAVAQQNCSLLMIGQHDLHGLFERDPKLGFIVLQNVLRYLSEQLRRTNQKILFLVVGGHVLLSGSSDVSEAFRDQRLHDVVQSHFGSGPTVS